MAKKQTKTVIRTLGVRAAERLIARQGSGRFVDRDRGALRKAKQTVALAKRRKTLAKKKKTEKGFKVSFVRTEPREGDIVFVYRPGTGKNAFGKVKHSDGVWTTVTLGAHPAERCMVVPAGNCYRATDSFASSMFEAASRVVDNAFDVGWVRGVEAGRTEKSATNK